VARLLLLAIAAVALAIVLRQRRVVTEAPRYQRLEAPGNTNNATTVAVWYQDHGVAMGGNDTRYPLADRDTHPSVSADAGTASATGSAASASTTVSVSGGWLLRP
jgi:hypothetical protein